MIPYTEKNWSKCYLHIGLLKETVPARMVFFKNTKLKVYLPYADTNCFDIVTRVLQENTLAPYLFIIWQNNKLWLSVGLIKENGFILKMTRCRQYPAETMTDVYNADDLALLVNTLALAESLLHSLEPEVGSIEMYMKTNKSVHVF